MLEEEVLKQRYGRQIAVTEIGSDGQMKLRQGSVLVIGCGALGSMVGMQLAGAGVKKLGLIDFDTIDISNLQRQFFFKTAETGKSKVETLSKRICELNSDVEVKKYSVLLQRALAEEIFKEYDFIIDASDNPETKRLTAELTLKEGKGCCIGGVRDFGGQVITLVEGSNAPEEYFGNGSTEGILPCSLGGVMGPAAAFCASVQASEAIKYLTGAGELLSGKLFVFDLLNNRFKVFSL